jgi:cardiolipin synthase
MRSNTRCASPTEKPTQKSACGTDYESGQKITSDTCNLYTPAARRLARTALAACALLAAGCSTLPRLEVDGVPRTPNFATATRVFSDEQNKAIVERLKRQAGDTDILTHHVAVSEAISGSPMVTGNQVILLEDGPATYAAMFAALRGATKHINFATYIFEPDEVGKQFADLLMEKRRQGVEVNVIYDSVGSHRTPKAFFDTMRKAGVRVVEFNPVNPFSALPGGGLNNRNHRKLIVVDGSTAFVGGINISNVYSTGSRIDVGSRASGASRSTRSWRDTHLQIDGPVVTEFQKVFLQSWEKQKAEPLAGNYLPALSPKGGHIVRAIASTPDDQRNELYLTLLSAITFAERNIHLTNAYFAPDPQFLEALQAAAKRGVDVKLILPGTTDSWLAFHAGRSHYASLLASGVKIYERRGQLLHAKTSTIDGVWSSVGTTNLDWRSFLHNDEVDAAILGREFARQMEEMFARDLEKSTRITAEQWAQRSPGLRLKEWAARMFEYML